jgi:hypothetical protein
LPKFQISNLKIIKFQIWKLPKFQNFKLNYRKEELNYGKADKSTSQGAFRIELQETTFLKEPKKKQGRLVWPLPFSKIKAL